MTAGSGIPIVLQHGFGGRKEEFFQVGLVDQLVASGFRVFALDSLGHGDSDKPSEWRRYLQKYRAGDITAVLDAEGVEKAHMLGYSMGGSMVCAVAQFAPERLLSATVAGWTPSKSIAEETPWVAALSIKAMAPFLGAAKSVTDDSIPARQTCWTVLCVDAHGQEEALKSLAVPLRFWIGTKDDHHYPGVKLMVQRNGWTALEQEGADHIDAMLDPPLNALADMLGEIAGLPPRARL